MPVLETRFVPRFLNDVYKMQPETSIITNSNFFVQWCAQIKDDMVFRIYRREDVYHIGRNHTIRPPRYENMGKVVKAI